ncbi:adherens junction formation factor afadin isoform X3 [Rhynchophorus ferrugineus]|uniref:adherens junction formation factor afadin isoform X3 n=1 Tax=Rhynchophorus ferrugineus TaxID=354439 RepID=UPI003FCEB9DC
MIGSSNDRRALEREALRNVINQWNANRLDLFELSEPNEDLEFHGVMRFYFQDSGQKVATKCIRVASDATVEDVIGTLVEKFRPDMRMLSVPSYALYELHEGCAERKMSPDEKPLLVQLNWHVDDREGRFLLRNIDDKTVGSMGSLDSNASFRRKLSKREKKQLKKQEKLSRMKSENGDINGGQDNVTEKLYNELPETSFTRSISNPEAVMRRRRQQKLEKKLQQFRSKDGGPDTGGTLKIYGEALCKDVPYKTLLLSVRDCAGAVVREMLDKYGLTKVDPSQFCLVQVTQQPGIPDTEYVLDDDECPLSILMTAPNTGSIMFHVRRRPADCAPRKRKKKPGALSGVRGEQRGDVPLLVELGPDGQTAHLGDANKTIRLVNEMMEVGSANGIALQLYAPHIQPRHCVITNAEGVTSLTPCHADAHTFVNGQRIHQTTILTHGSLVKFGNSNTYRFLDPTQEERTRHPLGNLDNQARIYERLSDMARFPRGQDPILPAVLEFPEEHQEQFLARAITHLDVTTPTFRLAPAYTLYLCARYRASTHYRPELTPTERAHKLTLLLQHAAMLIRHTVQDRSTESTSQAFWLANASELLHFLKSDRHVSAFSLQAQDTLADAVRLSFKNLVACLTDELNSAMNYLMSVTGDDHPREVINILSGAMNLLRKCRVNAALTIQLFSQLFHWISAKALSNVISNSNLCTRNFGHKLANRLRNLQAWAESQGLELAAECHLAKIVQCSHLLQASKYTPEDLANLSAACFKLNSMQLGALLMQYKAEPGEKIASPSLLEQAAKAAESVADELARAEGREVTLYEDPAPPLQLLLPEDGFSCDVVQGVPPGLADFLIPLQTAGLCRLAAQPTSSGHWTVYMNAPRPPSVLSATQPEVQVIRLHKAGGGMGLSIVAAKGAGQERLGIYIKSVVPGGAADKDGRLAAGDQLLSVDGQSLLGITQEKAAEFLVRTGSVVTLEVAKGGAVYHGLATLLQQPSPTPHRASIPDSNYYDTQLYYNYKSPVGSNESLYSQPGRKIYTPPVNKPKNNVFFNSDDSLFKTEKRKFVIPRIEIQSDEPVFNLQVTDFSEPKPKNITLSYDETGHNMKTEKVEEYCAKPKTKAQEFAQSKSFSIDVNRSCVDISSISETDKFLSIGTKRLARQRATSTSMMDLSSSTSSINSCIYESNLDLSQIDPDTPLKHWKSPFEIRHAKDLERDSKSTSDPVLNRHKYLVSNRSKSVSEENLTDKLTEYERLEILKLLHDWSLNGSESKSDFNMDLSKARSLDNLDSLDDSINHKFKKISQKYNSEPDLSPKSYRKLNGGDDELIVLGKYSSESKIASTVLEDDFLHKCKYRNCIFNVDFKPKTSEHHQSVDKTTNQTTKLKGILKNSSERLQTSNESLKENKNTECLNNIVNLQKNKPKLNFDNRRYSEIIETNKPINGELIRCDSLERLTQMRKHKKFPESYIVTRKGSIKNQKLRSGENGSRPKSPKVVVLRKKYMPKTWKSCSDIKQKKPVKKCCRYAKKTCPIMKNCGDSPRKTRKVQSCASINQDDVIEGMKVEFPSPKRYLRTRLAQEFPADSNWRMRTLPGPRISEEFDDNFSQDFPDKSKQTIARKATVRPFLKQYSLQENSKCCSSCPLPSTRRYTSQDPFLMTPPAEEDVAFGAQPFAARLDAGISLIPGSAYLVHRPRRMSERDLPSRVDSERSIPSSKSVPALHQIHSPNQDPPRTPGGQTSNFLVDGYSRTSSNNSINTNNLHGGVQNGPAALRSRSTHNLNQQDAGFYQNLSVYRNKMPSPQQLGDRTSALRSSQNSLQSSITSPPNSQRPSSAYYPTNQTPNFNRPNLHQSIPNLKSPPSMQRLQQGEESGRLSGSYPNMGGQGQQYYGQHPAYTPGQQPPYQRQGNQQNYQGPGSDDLNRSQYGSPYSNSNQPYPSPTHSGNPNYSQANNIQNNYSHTMPHQLHGSSNLPPNLNSSNKMEDRGDSRMDQRSYANTNPGGLLREDIYRQAQTNKHEDMMRYPSTNNVRISEAQIQSSRGNEDLNRHQEIRTSKSEDMLKHHHQGEMMRYASSGNIRAHDLNQPLRPSQDHMHQHRMNNDDRSLRGGQAKLVEMGEEVRRRQQQQQSQARLMNQTYSPQQMQHNAYYQQQQHYYNTQMAQSMQNLSINPTYQNQQPLTQASSGYNQHYPQSTAQQATYQTTTNSTYYSGHGPTSPSYRPQNMNQKTPKRTDSPPALPPTSTHPLYSPTAQGDSSSTIYTASNQDPPKMAFYPATPSTTNSKPPRDPWAREEQERQQEARREAARQWQEQQIKELISLPYRTSQQEEQLRALQLEREFQRRAQEAAGEDDEDTEKESPSPQMPQPVSSQTVISTVPSTTVSSKQEPSQVPPTSILKPGGVNTNQIPPVINSQREVLSTNQGPISPTETTAPPPPERGSSFAVMSMRAKDGVGKRVSFDPVSTQNNVQQTPQIPTSLPVEESVREDPNSFIMQAESMLASPTTPNEASPNVATATPGVIGAQEVYRDPRARRLAEQQKKNMNENSPVPEKLSFKEKMKMFAMETGEQGTPKDKSKISRAQREIDNLGTAPSSGMVH